MNKFLNNKGFTLVELMITVAVIGVLSAIIIASVSGSRTKAGDAKQLAHLKELQGALELYAVQHSAAYPGTDNTWYDSGCDTAVFNGTSYTDISTIISSYYSMPSTAGTHRCIWYGRNITGDTNVQPSGAAYAYLILYQADDGSTPIGTGNGCYTGRYCIGVR